MDNYRTVASRHVTRVIRAASVKVTSSPNRSPGPSNATVSSLTAARRIGYEHSARFDQVEMAVAVAWFVHDRALPKRA